MSSTFVFVSTALTRPKPLEDLWVFGFQPGGFEVLSWGSNEAKTPVDLTNLGNRAIGAMKLTIAVPVPLANIFTVKAHFERLRIYASRLDLTDWPYSYDFDGPTVLETKLLPKESFGLRSNVLLKLQSKGSLAWLTPLAVTLFLKPP